jgi:hypothetical protein
MGTCLVLEENTEGNTEESWSTHIIYEQEDNQGLRNTILVIPGIMHNCNYMVLQLTQFLNHHAKLAVIFVVTIFA